jgi:MYXO-CTERM domain-containing protein
VRSECAAFAGTQVSCRAASCDAASELILAATCDGAGNCPAEKKVPCAPFACQNGACTTTCASDTDCAGNARCNVSTKQCLSAATCEGHVVTEADGGTTDCSPFRCDSSGKCLDKCATVDDCVAPLVCDAHGACIAANTGAAAKGCGCVVAGGSEDDARGIVLALLLGAAIRRRRSSQRCT